MEYLPIFMDVRDARCLVVGGGAVAGRKVALLREAKARVTVVAPELCDAVAALARDGAVAHVPRTYDAADLEGQRLVIAATDDGTVNAQVSADARARSMPVNVVDSPALCSFIVPAIVDRAPVTVAVSTGGASPVLARLTRSRLEAVLPPNYGRLAEWAARHRDRVKRDVPDSTERRRLWERALGGEVAERVLAGDADGAAALLEALIDGSGGDPAVHLCVIHGGDGDVQRLSLGAVARLSAADLVVHAGARVRAIAALARRDAHQLEAGPDSASVYLAAADALQHRSGATCRVVVVVPGERADDKRDGSAPLAALAPIEHLGLAPA